MKKILQFTANDGNNFLIEVDESTISEPMRGNSIEGSDRGIIQTANENFEKALNPLKTISNGIINCIKEITSNPDEIEVELGLKFSAKAGIILTSLDSEANLKIVLKWKKS